MKELNSIDDYVLRRSIEIPNLQTPISSLFHHSNLKQIELAVDFRMRKSVMTIHSAA